MAGYFEEMGWRELEDGEQPNQILLMTRYLLDSGIYGDYSTDEWKRLPPPACKQVVKDLPLITIESDDKSCPICLRLFQKGNKVKQMPCHHAFHPTCILTWLEKTNSCPCCRYELPTNDEVYEAYKKEKKRAEQRKEELEILHNSMFG